MNQNETKAKLSELIEQWELQKKNNFKNGKDLGLFEETRFLKGCYFGSTRTFEDCIDDLNNILKEL